MRETCSEVTDPDTCNQKIEADGLSRSEWRRSNISEEELRAIGENTDQHGEGGDAKG